MILFLAASAALAAEPAYYHPDTIAKKSVVFAKSSDGIVPAFEERDKAADRAGALVHDLEIGVVMLGDTAPAPLVAWLASTRRQVGGDTVRLQKHVDLLGEDYSAVFTAAMDRALPSVGKGYEVVECGAAGVMAMMGHSDCKGTDLSAALAAAMDADAVLVKELADIAAVPWPTLDVPSAVQEPVALTGSTRWVSARAIYGTYAAQVIKARTDALDAEVGPLLEEGTAEAIAKAKGFRETWQSQLSGDGARLRELVVAALQRAEKKGGPAQVAWCPNPIALGGCTGEDATEVVIKMLAADKKFAKDVAKQAR